MNPNPVLIDRRLMANRGRTDRGWFPGRQGHAHWGLRNGSL